MDRMVVALTRLILKPFSLSLHVTAQMLPTTERIFFYKNDAQKNPCQAEKTKWMSFGVRYELCVAFIYCTCSFFFNLLPYKKKNFPHDKILIFGLTLVGEIVVVLTS